MQWIASNTPEDSRFLVLNEAITWHIDFLSEWFPALTGRASLATVQGTEWLPDDRYRQSAERYAQLQDCAGVGSTACLEAWAGQGGVEFTHVYVAPAVQGALAAALLADTDYHLVYLDRGVTIFERDGGDE
jgi:hypothetical protein